MRLLVTTAPFRGLTAKQTGSALAQAWADLGVQVAVVPMADLVRDPSGEAFAQAVHDIGGPQALLLPAMPQAVDERASSSVAALGEWDGSDDLVIADSWPAPRWHDGGAGLLHALGARADRPLDQGVATLAGVGRVDLEPVRGRLAGRDLVLATTAEQAALQLTGLRGITSVLGHARRDDPSVMLATDQALVDWCAALGRPELATTPGAGACGGLGAAVLALGGRVLAAPRYLADRVGLRATMGQADLVVAGYDQLEFGTKGGDLFVLLAELADDAMRPLVAVARTNFISARELRTMGVEAGYALSPDDAALDAGQVTEAVRGIARTWHW